MDQTIGERDRRYQDYLKGLRRMGCRPRLVVDNTRPLPSIRRRQGAIQGIRTIYGDDQGGPPDAA